MAYDIFKDTSVDLTGADWRRALGNVPKAEDFMAAPKAVGEVQFAQQLFKAEDENRRMAENAVIKIANEQADLANARYKERTAEERLAATATKKQTKQDEKALAALPTLDPDIPELPPTWAETQSVVGYSALPYKQQAKVLGAFKEQEALRRAKGDLATKYEDHVAAVDKLLPDVTDPAKIKRSALQAAEDFGIGVGTGAASGIKGLADAADIAFDSSIARSVSQSIDKGTKAERARLSDKAKALNAEDDKSLAQLVDPFSAAGTIANQALYKAKNLNLTDVGNIVGNAIPMLLTGYGLGALKIGEVGVKGAQLAYGVASTAGEIGGGARDAILSADIEALKQSPYFDKYKSQGLSDQAIRARMAEDVAKEGALYGAGIGAISSIIGLKFGGEAAITGLATGKKVGNVLGKTAVETGLNAVEEGGGRATQNITAKAYDPTINVAEGVGTEGVLGAVGGGAMTAATGTAANFRPGAEATAPAIGGDAQPLDITQGAPAPAPNTAKEAARARAAEALGTPLSTATENVAAQATNAPAADQLTQAEKQAFARATAQARGPDNVEMPTGAFTTQADIDALYTKTIEDMYIATDTVAATENVASQATNAPAPGEIEATQPAPIDHRTEMVGKLVTAYADQSDLSSVGTIRKVDAQLEVLGEEPLTQDERAKTDRILGAARTFAVQPRLPSDPTAAVSPIDQGANSGVVDWRAERDATALASKPKAPSLGVVNSLIGFSTHSQVTPEQRTNIAQKFVNGTLTTATQNAIDATGFGLTVQGGASVGLEWARVAQEGGEVLTHLASDAKQTGEGVNAQARAVIEMYRQSGTPLPTVSTVDALPITSKLGTVSAMFQPTEKTIVATPGTAAPTLVHEYLHGVTYEGLRAATKTKEGRETLSLMRWVRAQVNMQAAAENKERPYATTDNDELLADMFNPEFLVLANNTPIGKPADAGARAALERIQGNSSTIAQLINRIIETLLRFAGVTPQANSVATIMGGLAAQATALQAQAIGVQSTNGNTNVSSTERLQPLASARSTAISEPEMQSALDGLARAEESRFNTGTRRLYSDGGSPLPYTRRMGSSLDGRVSALGRAFGVRVAVVQVRKGFESLYGRFEAVVQPSTGILLIKDTSQRPHLALLGHETVHVLKTENPALYEEFRAAVDTYVNSGAYQGFADTGVARMSDGTEAGVKEEFLAEVVSDGFTNEAFWEALGNKNPSLLRYIMQTAKTLISNARFALIGKKTRTGGYLTDFDAVMKIAGEVMGKFSDSRGNSLGLDLDTTPSAPLPAVVRGNRESVSEILDDINSGAPAQAATPMQALYQAAKAKDAGAIRETLAKLADNTNTAFHDNIAPAKKWLMSLAVPEVMRQKIVNLLYLAPGRRDALQTEVMEKHGGADMHKAVYALANDAKVSYETASLWTGNWLTAKRAEATNQMLIDRDTQAAKDATTLPEAEALRLALEARIDAVFDPDLTKGKPDNPHLKGVAGGMSNAQAAATIVAVEKRLDPQRLAQIAEHIYSMNAYRLALDVETGRATPEVVAKFLNNPAVEPLLTQLATQGPRATDALRQQVRDAVRSDYVPMTGHPLSSIDGDDRGVLSSGTVQPNVSKTHSMDGRTIGVADDGISTTLEGVIKSATFAGFADFTTEIGAAYDTMTAAERAQAGISRVNINGLTRLGDNIILDGRTQNRIGYALDDRRVLESLRKANVEDTNRLLSLMSVPTSMFAYAATQLNPTFAFTNVINDTWERNVIMKTRDFFKPDGTKIDSVAAAERMKFLLLNGSAIASVNRHLRGKPNMNNPMDVSLHDLIATGGLSLRSDTLATNTASAKAKGARGSSVGRRVLSTAGDWIQAYNKSLDLVAPLLSYQVLRDAGLDRTAAAGGALDLMNFRKKGTVMALVSANYAFAQPAVTGGANMVKALATRSGRRQFGVYLVISMALRAIATALGDEDEGGNVIDQRPEYERDTKYLFQFGGYVAKFPAGFGLTRLANNLSSQIRDIYIGKQGVAEGVGKFLMSGIVPAITPLEDTKIKDFWTKTLHLLSPTIFKPIVALSGNTTSFGAPINNEQWINAERYRHLQGNPNTAEFYRDVAKGLHEITGEDASPEAVKHVINSYSLGAFRIALNEAVNNPDKEAKGKPTAPAILSPVLAPVSEAGKTAQFYEAQSELLELTRREDTGEKLVGDDKQLAKLRDEWKEKQDGFAKETKAETKKLDQRQITETLLAKRKADIQKRKSAAQDQWLVKWRRAKGL